MKRRAFLELLAAAPIAALAPWRPSTVVGFDVGTGPSYAGIVHYYQGNIVAFVEEFVSAPLEPWQIELLLRRYAARAVNPPVRLT